MSTMSAIAAFLLLLLSFSIATPTATNSHARPLPFSLPCHLIPLHPLSQLEAYRALMAGFNSQSRSVAQTHQQA
ncbi:hypothetical protein BDV19DRAFT_373068 [Aspergillus venezuelensis]